MAYRFLTNKSLEQFIQKVPMDENIRKELLERLPKMGKEDRIELVDTLKDVILLEKEKEEVIKGIKE